MAGNKMPRPRHKWNSHAISRIELGKWWRRLDGGAARKRRRKRVAKTARTKGVEMASWLRWRTSASKPSTVGARTRTGSSGDGDADKPWPDDGRRREDGPRRAARTSAPRIVTSPRLAPPTGHPVWPFTTSAPAAPFQLLAVYCHIRAARLSPPRQRRVDARHTGPPARVGVGVRPRRQRPPDGSSVTAILNASSATKSSTRGHGEGRVVEVVHGLGLALRAAVALAPRHGGDHACPRRRGCGSPVHRTAATAPDGEILSCRRRTPPQSGITGAERLGGSGMPFRAFIPRLLHRLPRRRLPSARHPEVFLDSHPQAVQVVGNTKQQ
uniref:Uncharacterized protein n=1 Tax=Oryza sativa subsp. japonica TaxID=39947 RepID=Q6I5C2_ORYSJ|nr:hypothetical protein [Oryza sativa Japonica Group]